MHHFNIQNTESLNIDHYPYLEVVRCIIQINDNPQFFALVLRPPLSSKVFSALISNTSDLKAIPTSLPIMNTSRYVP